MVRHDHERIQTDVREINGNAPPEGIGQATVDGKDYIPVHHLP